MSDVCLFVEGTYPYVSGGVASWTHELVSRLSNLTFSIVYIGSRSDEPLFPKFKLPSNINGVHEYYLFDEFTELEHSSKIPDKPLSLDMMNAFKVLHGYLHYSKSSSAFAPIKPMSDEDIKNFSGAIKTLFPQNLVKREIFNALASKQVWDLILDEYNRMGFQIPFIDYFYTWRAAHIPILRVLGSRFPKARVYHALCAGYAGVAATQASIQHNVPLILTEHGIYSHERSVEIFDADWLTQPSEKIQTDDSSEYFKKWWIELFRNISRITYGFSSEIITLYEGNRKREINDGAEISKTKIIANGISSKFNEIRRKNNSWNAKNKNEKVFQIGFLGRVVSIKDIKTLIKSMRTLKDSYSNFVCSIVGPTQDEPQYVKECQELVNFLELQDNVKFVGEMKATEFYPSIDCLILTSISEAQPLVILEANIAGVPVVTTNVGSCSELINGSSEADILLGPSGLMAPIGNSDAIAEACFRIISEEGLWESFSIAGIKRVNAFYQEKTVWTQYHGLYRDFLTG